MQFINNKTEYFQETQIQKEDQSKLPKNHCIDPPGSTNSTSIKRPSLASNCRIRKNLNNFIQNTQIKDIMYSMQISIVNQQRNFPKNANPERQPNQITNHLGDFIVNITIAKWQTSAPVPTDTTKEILTERTDHKALAPWHLDWGLWYTEIYYKLAATSICSSIRTRNWSLKLSPHNRTA